MKASGRFGDHRARLLARTTAWLVLAGVAVTAAWALDPDVAAEVRARKAELAPLCPGLLALKVPLTPQQTSQKALCQLYGINKPEQTPEAAKVPDAAKAPDTPVPVNDADPFSDAFSNSDSLPPGYHCHFYGLGKKVCHGSGMD
jgi:hypothetical protein